LKAAYKQYRNYVIRELGDQGLHTLDAKLITQVERNIVRNIKNIEPPPPDTSATQETTNVDVRFALSLL